MSDPVHDLVAELRRARLDRPVIQADDPVFRPSLDRDGASQGPDDGAVGDDRGQASDGPPIVFKRPSELRDLVPERREWVVDGLIARRAITLVGGKPKVGKSTLIGGLGTAVASGAGSFLGLRAAQGEVVVVTEEGRDEALAKYGHERFSLLTREDIWPLPSWEALIEAVVARCDKVGAVLVSIDTLAKWSRMAAETEKDSGASQAVVDQLQAVCNTGAGVLLNHHQRKGIAGDDDAIDSFRGSSAIAAAVDCLVAYERVKGDTVPASYRQLVTVARWQAPPLLLVDWDQVTNGWSVVGRADSRSEAGAQVGTAQVLAALTDDGTTYEALCSVLNADKRKFKPIVDQLVDEGQIMRSGSGRKGDPYRFTRTSDSVPGFRTAPRTANPAEPPPFSVPTRRGDGNGTQYDGFRPEHERDGNNGVDADVNEQTP